MNQRFSNVFNFQTYETADIPECRERTDLESEYRDFPEEKLWSPSEDVDKWFPDYNVMARSVLTFVQERQNISNEEAMENACSGYAEQYISDVLHNSEYKPEVALKKLLNKELPRKIVEKWTEEDVVSLFRSFHFKPDIDSNRWWIIMEPVLN